MPPARASCPVHDLTLTARQSPHEVRRPSCGVLRQAGVKAATYDQASSLRRRSPGLGARSRGRREGRPAEQGSRSVGHRSCSRKGVTPRRPAPAERWCAMTNRRCLAVLSPCCSPTLAHTAVATGIEPGPGPGATRRSRRPGRHGHCHRAGPAPVAADATGMHADGSNLNAHHWRALALAGAQQGVLRCHSRSGWGANSRFAPKAQPPGHPSSPNTADQRRARQRHPTGTGTVHWARLAPTKE